jgi:hypothetical protein
MQFISLYFFLYYLSLSKFKAISRLSATLRQRPRWPVRIHFRLIIANESIAFQS